MSDCASESGVSCFIGLNELTFPVDWSKVFRRKARLEIEIGFGTGEYLVHLAESAPSKDFIGVEQCAERIVKTMRKIEQAGLSNIRLLRVDATLAFRYLLTDELIDRVHCLFPCPWPKKRHAKHRLFSGDFLKLVNRRLVPQGQIYLVTDHVPYADWIEEKLEGTGFNIGRREIPAQFGTKFEKKWRAAGQELFVEMVLAKASSKNGPEIRSGEVKTFYIEKINPDNVHFPRLAGPITIEFKDYLFDVPREKGMVQAFVTEERQTQFLWIMIQKTSKGWCLGAAAGNSVLPTAGILRAIEMARDAFQYSLKS